MTKKEYEEKLQKIDDNYNREKELLYSDYALSNNPVKLGDIIADSHTTIKVEGIKVIILNCIDFPICVYFGTEIKQDGTPKKSLVPEKIYQYLLKFINGKEYKQE